MISSSIVSILSCCAFFIKASISNTLCTIVPLSAFCPDGPLHPKTYSIKYCCSHRQWVLYDELLKYVIIMVVFLYVLGKKKLYYFAHLLLDVYYL